MHGHHLRKVGYIVLSFAIVLFCVEISVRRFFFTDEVARVPIDYTSSTVYMAKLEAFRRYRGPKIALIGDSVARGGALRAAGVKPWQFNELSSNLQRRITNSDVLIANFGVDGARPADLEVLTLDLIAAGATAFICILGMRAFSGDFEQEAERYAITWHENLKFNELGQPQSAASLNSELFEIWVGYYWNTLMFVQYHLHKILDAPLRALLTQIRKDLNANDDRRADEELSLLLNTRKRYAAIDINSSRAQTLAFLRWLEIIKSHRLKSIFVYATENSAFSEEVISDSDLQKIRSNFERLIGPFFSNLIYFGPDASMTPSQFLDHIHPNVEGYRMMATRIESKIGELLRKNH